MIKLLELKGIYKSFSGVYVLSDINLSFNKGEVHAVVGENGAGKSTLMNIIFGVYQPDRGEILWKGNKVLLTHPLEAQKIGIGMIHQERALLPHLTVAENICLGYFPQSHYGFINFKSMYTKAIEMLKTFGLDNIYPNQLVGKLSTSERQLVEILKVLFLKPELIIMDEPTASLTLSESKRLLQVIKDLSDRGVSII